MAFSVTNFQNKIWHFYRKNARTFPWRHIDDPYKITVSEIMLQQTQVSRVIPFYMRFIEELPNWQTLANVSTPELLRLWQGLGYNRRALYLKQTAQAINDKWQGILPQDQKLLTTLPGIGENTAGAIIAYAFNHPSIFIETNIRKSIIYHFFADKNKVTDHEIRVILSQVLDTQHPREWYYALTDFGAHLGKNKIVRNNRSLGYKKQSKFEGSHRQLRAQIIRLILAKEQTLPELIKYGIEKEKLVFILNELVDEGFLQKVSTTYRISK